MLLRDLPRAFGVEIGALDEGGQRARRRHFPRELADHVIASPVREVVNQQDRVGAAAQQRLDGAGDPESSVDEEEIGLRRALDGPDALRIVGPSLAPTGVPQAPIGPISAKTSFGRAAAGIAVQAASTRESHSCEESSVVTGPCTSAAAATVLPPEPNST